MFSSSFVSTVYIVFCSMLYVMESDFVFRTYLPYRCYHRSGFLRRALQHILTFFCFCKKKYKIIIFLSFYFKIASVAQLASAFGC